MPLKRRMWRQVAKTMKTISIKYDIGDEVIVADIDGLHVGIVMHAQWTSTAGTYYTVQYLQQNENRVDIPIYWEFTEKEIDKATAAYNGRE